MLPSEIPGLTVETVEWLPAGGATGLLRIRGSWSGPEGRRTSLPVLVVGTGEEAAKHVSLPEPRQSADGGAWRGAYILRAELIETGESLALELEGGRRFPIPSPAVAPVSAPRTVTPSAEAGEPGGEVIDRAVLAERRVRRAEEAEQAQARVAAEALKALEVLELRGIELERRIEELTDDAAGEELRSKVAAARAEAVRLTQELASARDTGRAEVEAAQNRIEQAAAAREAAISARAERQRVALVSALDSATAMREAVSGWAARFRSAELARTSDAVRLAVLEARRDSRESDLLAARATLAERGQELESLRDQAGLAAITIEEAYGAAAQAREALLAAGEEAAALESELQATKMQLDAAGRERSEERELAQVRGAALEAEREATALQRRLLQESRTVAATAQAELRVERVARATLAAQLAEERRRRGAAESQRDQGADAASDLKASADAARERAQSAESARDALAADLAAARRRLTALEAARQIHPPVALATPSVDAAALARRAIALGPARGKVDVGQADPARLRLHLDAAAAALRARTPELGEVVEPAPTAHPPGRPLREVLIELASSDPATAARLIAALLPAQGALLGGRLDYDLTVAELGTIAVTATGPVTRVRRLAAPRSRLRVDFRIVTSAMPLARLLAGSGPPLRRFRGSVLLMGRRGKRARRLLQSVQASTASLAGAARAGARFEPGDVLRALASAIDPSWTRDQIFSVAVEVTGPGGGTWFVVVADGARVTTRTSLASQETASATVTLNRSTFDALLRDEPAGARERPRVRGDRAAVGCLKAWMDRARGVAPDEGALPSL